MERNIRLLELTAAMKGMMFILPVMMPFYRDQMGLGFGDFMIADAVFAATVVLLEVPTGWISDVWRRKTTLMLGTLFGILGFAVMTVAESLAMAIAAEVLLGVGLSLVSGTDGALLYDTLLTGGRTKDFARLEGRRRAVNFYASALSSVAGGLMYAVHHQLPVAMTTVATMLGLLAVAALDEPERHKRAPEKHPLADMAETIRYAARGHAEVALVVLFAAGLFAATKIIMWAQQPYYMALGLDESLFGVLFAVGYVLAGVSFHAAHWIGRHMGLKTALVAVWGMTAAVTALSGLAVGPHGVALLMVGGSCVYGLAAPRVDDAINRVTTSDRRATVLSASNLLRQLLFIPLSVVMGLVSDHAGIGTALLVMTGWLALAGLALALWRGRRKKAA